MNMNTVIWSKRRLDTISRFYVSFSNDVEKDKDTQWNFSLDSHLPYAESTSKSRLIVALRLNHFT